MLASRSRIVALIATSTVLSTLGCSKSSIEPPSQPSRTIEAASSANAAQLVADGRNADAAKEYARIGELLLMPEGIQYADSMFEKALALDTNNGKANFYSAITKPLMKMQGFITRFSQIADPKEAAKFLQLRKEIEGLGLPELTKFSLQLPAGKAPFSTYQEVQRFMRTELLPEVLNSVEKLTRLSGRRDLELNINLSRLGFPKQTANYESTCNRYEQSWTDSYGGGRDFRGNPIPKQHREIHWNCYYSSTVDLGEILMATRVLIDASDLKIARGSMMAFADVLRLNSAYGFEGLQEVLENLRELEIRRQNVGRNVYARDIIEELQRHPALFELERDQDLINLVNSQERVLRDALALGELQAELCLNERRLQGENLIKSFCLWTGDLQNVQMAIDLLTGPRPIKIGYDINHDQVDVLVDLPTFIKNPPRDMKALFPTRFSPSDKPIRWNDLTFNGLIPNGDLVEKLEHVVVGSPRPFKIKRPILH